MGEQLSTGNLAKFWLDTKRIFAISKKPNRKEYGLTLKITLVGLAITGILSYVIQMIAQIIDQSFAS